MTDRKRPPARIGGIFFGVVLRLAYHRFQGKWFDYERPEERDLNGSLGGLFQLLAANFLLGLGILGTVLSR